MTGFAQALPVVLQIEGGFVNDPDDRGGATNHGVTQATYNAYLAAIGQPIRDVRHITRDEIEHLYHTRYWLQAKCDALPWPISVAVFDAAVNHGDHRAVMILQQALTVKTDGVVGPVTITAAEGADPVRLVEDILWLRLALYRRLAEDRSQLKFLRGWIGRMMHLRKELLS